MKKLLAWFWLSMIMGVLGAALVYAFFDLDMRRVIIGMGGLALFVIVTTLAAYEVVLK